MAKKDIGGGDYYYLYNGHGDVVQMADRNGNVVNNYEYDEWGNILTSTETVSNPFKYATEKVRREELATVGLKYNSIWDDITENDIRAEHNLDLRGAY